MEEKITLRLYENPLQEACCESQKYYPDKSVKGWQYEQGQQIGLHERDGGYLMGRIALVHPGVHADERGRYKLVDAWTLD